MTLFILVFTIIERIYCITTVSEQFIFFGDSIIYEDCSFIAYSLCIGSDNSDNIKVKIFAPDHEAFVVFAPLFDPIIKAINGIPERKPIKNVKREFGDVRFSQFDDLDAAGNYIKFTQLEVYRSLEQYGFHPVLTKEVGK